FFYGCPDGYMHQAGQCITCPQVIPDGRSTWRNAINGQCGYCPANASYINGQCFTCANGQRLYPEVLMCGTNGQPWTPALIVAPDPVDLVAGSFVALNANDPRACYAYSWAAAADALWPELQTPDATTYPVVRYR